MVQRRAARPIGAYRLGPVLVAVVLLVALIAPWAGGSAPATLPAPDGAARGPAGAGPASDPAPTPIAPPRIVPRLPAPAAGVVDPYAFVQHEPASLGVTDYGVNAAGAGYTYSTPIWWAEANITRLLAYYPSPVEYDGNVSLQLNVVVKLTAPDNTPFAYWIQDVVSLDTIGDTVSYLDNVWNLSAGGSIEPGTLEGNGSVGSFGPGYFYGDSPACQGRVGGYPGNCARLSAPATITVRVTTGHFQGVPHVSFQYANGGTWVTYDNVSFPFAANYQDNDFTVDGTQYTPYNLFYDAEWDYTGPGGGATMEDRNSSMLMELERWNGHNLEAPPNAYNFGSNTGESISNVLSTAVLNSTNGTVGSQITTGPGSLDMLYSSNDVATLDVSAPSLLHGIVTVNGGPHPFVGTTAVLTLAPGTYNVTLWDGTTFVASAPSTTLTGGITSYLYLGYPTPYTAEFVEQGLPSTLEWSLTVGGVPYPDNGPSLALELTNGTYNYTVDPVEGYTLTAYAGTFTVDGGDVTVFVNFTASEIPVTFTESGLVSGTNWSVTLAGALRSATGTSIVFEEPNGSYPFTVTAGPTYEATPSSSAVVVQGFPEFESIAFSLQPGYLTGHLTPTTAALFVGGSPETTVDGAFNVSLLPGVYTVEVTATGYLTNWTNVTIAPAAAFALGVVLTPAHGGGGGGSASGSGSGVSLETAALLILVAAVVAVGVIAAALVAARRRRR